ELGGKREYGPISVDDHMQTGAFRDPAGNVFGVYFHPPHDWGQKRAEGRPDQPPLLRANAGIATRDLLGPAPAQPLVVPLLTPPSRRTTRCRSPDRATDRARSRPRSGTAAFRYT